MKPENYIKVDGDKLIREDKIRWIAKTMNDCLEICMKSDGCVVSVGTHKICKANNPESYGKVVKLFA
jgi:hypothetical protein